MIPATMNGKIAMKYWKYGGTKRAPNWDSMIENRRKIKDKYSFE